MKQLYQISILVSSTLVLTGCIAGGYPNVYEFAEPANLCGDQEIFLSVDEAYPDVFTFFSEGGEGGDVSYDVLRAFSTEIVLTVSDELGQPVSAGVMDTIDIEYRFGFFNSEGFQNIDNSLFSSRSIYSDQHSPSPSPIPDRESFFDILWDVDGPTPSAEPSDGTINVPITATESTIRGTVLELLDIDYGDDFGGGEEQLLAALYPGAFIAKCNLSGYESNSFVAAAQIYPNSSLLDLQPELIIQDEDNYVLSFQDPGIYGELSLLGTGGFAETSSLSLGAEPGVDRWLSFYSQTGLEGFSFTPSDTGDLNRNGSGTTVYSSTMAPLEPGSYQMLVGYLFSESDYLNSDVFLAAGVAHYDLVVSSSGYSFTWVEAPFDTFVNGPSGATGNAPVSIDDGQLPLVVSTKGFGEVTVAGAYLDGISRATIGNKEAKVVSKTWSSLTLDLPKQSAGKHDLALTHSAGTLIKKDSVRYRKSQVIKSQQLAVSGSKAKWLVRLGNALTASPATVQVNCAASVPEGAAGKALIKKARWLCGEAKKLYPDIKTKVVIKKVPAGSKSTMGLRFWN